MIINDVRLTTSCCEQSRLLFEIRLREPLRAWMWMCVWTDYKIIKIVLNTTLRLQKNWADYFGVISCRFDCSFFLRRFLYFVCDWPSEVSFRVHMCQMTIMDNNINMWSMIETINIFQRFFFLPLSLFQYLLYTLWREKVLTFLIWVISCPVAPINWCIYDCMRTSILYIHVCVWLSHKYLIHTITLITMVREWRRKRAQRSHLYTTIYSERTINFTLKWT